MKQGNAHQSFDELDRIIRDQAEKKLDVVVDVKDVQFLPATIGEDFDPEWGGLSPSIGRGIERKMVVKLPPTGDKKLLLDISPKAMDDIATYTHTPSRYINYMAKEKEYSLIATNLNTWFQNADPKRSRRMLRAWKGDGFTGSANVMSGKLRSLVSDQYMRIDNELLFDVVKPALDELHSMGIDIASMNCNEDFFNLKLTCPRLRREVKVGDVVEAGLRFKNSETGLSYFLMDDFLNRLTCLNGCVSGTRISDGIKKRHRGGRYPIGILPQYLDDKDAYSTYVTELRKDITKMIKQCLSDERFEKIVEGLRVTAHVDTTIKHLDVIERGKVSTIPALELVDNEWGISSADKKSIVHHLHNDRDYTQWGFANAITRTANDHSSYDEATRLEEIGGKILAFHPRQWQVYQNAEFKEAA